MNEKNVIQEIELLGGFKVFVETYGAIAATSLRRIRNSVLQNRYFHTGLGRLYQDIRRAIRLKLKIKDSKKVISFVFRERPKQTVFVILSANTGLYGDVIQRTINFFVTEYANVPGDVVVIGKVGKRLVAEMMPKRVFTYFDFPDDRIAIDTLKLITKHLEQYEKVYMMHAVFRSFVQQQIKATSVSGEELMEQSEPQEKKDYFFEPSLETISQFFETEIFASLLEQVFYESRLAKLAARMLLLDRATVNVESHLKALHTQREQVLHLMMNKKQTNSLTGIFLWH